MALAPVLGAIAGVAVTCFKNGLCSLPFYRKPWEHVLSGTAGAYAFQWVVKKEEEMVAQIEQYYSELDAKSSQPQ